MRPGYSGRKVKNYHGKGDEMEEMQVIRRGNGRSLVRKQPEGGEQVPRKRGRPPTVKQPPEFIEALTAGRQVEQVSLSAIDLLDETFKFRVALRVKDLADSIEKNGQQMPVILRRVPGKELLQIISGFRRITSLHKVGWETASAIVLEDVSDEEAFRISVLENEKRKTYSDIDRAYAITKYRQMGLTVSDIARDVFGLSRKQVERLQKLTELPAEVQEAIAEERLTTTVALVLHQMHTTHGADKIDLGEWLGRATDEDLSVRELKSAVTRSLAAGAPEPIELFVHATDRKSGNQVYRFRPVRIDPKAMAADERKAMAASLREILSDLEAN